MCQTFRAGRTPRSLHDPTSSPSRRRRLVALASLAGALIDSIGPRLSGTPGYASAVTWLESRHKAWGIPVRREQYSTWRGWTQGTVHERMIAPSPDWFARVANVDLRDMGGWAAHRTVVLMAYDSGGDAGTTYLAPDRYLTPKRPTMRASDRHFVPRGKPMPVELIRFVKQ